ncbi:MAG: DNA translocase FtsK 4TM domain-containing protein, partial [Flavobacteriaceae bacterium]
MAKKKESTSIDPTTRYKRRQRQILIGSFLMLLGFLLLIAFSSYLLHWKADQSAVAQLSNSEVVAENITRKLGAWVSHQMITQFFGISAYIIAVLLIISGAALFFNKLKSRLLGYWAWGMLYMIWISLALAFFKTQAAILSGTLGFEVFTVLERYIGSLGILSLLAFVLICILVVQWKLTPELILQRIKKPETEQPQGEEQVPTSEEVLESIDVTKADDEEQKPIELVSESSINLDQENAGTPIEAATAT